jgi:hypothetical protein
MKQFKVYDKKWKEFVQSPRNIFYLNHMGQLSYSGQEWVAEFHHNSRVEPDRFELSWNEEDEKKIMEENKASSEMATETPSPDKAQEDLLKTLRYLSSRIENLENIVALHEKYLSSYSPSHCEQCDTVHWKKNK